MQISMTKFRSEMYRVLSALKDNEQVLLTYEGKVAYKITKANQNRNARFEECLDRCPKLAISDEEVLSFKNEGHQLEVGSDILDCTDNKGMLQTVAKQGVEKK